MDQGDVDDPLHPWNQAYFDHRGRYYNTLEGAYQAWRGGAHQPGYARLTGGQAWARGARKWGNHHDWLALEAAVRSRHLDHPGFHDAVQGHTGAFRAWHQEPRVARRLEVLYARLRSHAVLHQAPIHPMRMPVTR